MANSIKQSAGGLALQITTEARNAGMVVEDNDGAATRRAEVYVYGFDDLLLLIDSETIGVSHRAELVTAATQDTNSIHRGGLATIEIAGNGYQIQLPGCQDAGFRLGDTAPVSVGDGVLVIHDGEGSRLAGDLLTLRGEQVSS
ncbi:hypothetical protein [Halonotius pteroides]|uniref:Uncharacterized protein n=1 Tax=Halonotius pteroides TaxID=268735 RepID=A0A3A6PX64_9EURY|nr:hypothetical protein [Halonotius pteroides]RJX47698.1 hypothetical protein DP106_14290 [Halonotius pteroides]